MGSGRKVTRPGVECECGREVSVIGLQVRRGEGSDYLWDN